MKNKKTEIFALVIILIIQTIIYVYVGVNKLYIHIDEAYSYGLSNYDKVEIEDNEDFYDNWHSRNYYEDYLSIQEHETGDYAPVYENQKNDVHPPFYYLLLRVAMEFTKGYFTKWSGIILNIIIYALVTIFMYLILKRLFKDDKNSNIKALILAFMSSITLASCSNVVYIRMYALLTLEILITIFLHIKLLEQERINPKLLVGIGISVLVGVLTHYYYLIYLAVLYLIFLIKYIKEKKLKNLLYYTLTMVISGILSLIIFPYSINHMFFGYRGQGVISNFENISEIIPNIMEQIRNLNYYGFNKLMFVILIISIVFFIYNKIRKKDVTKISKEKKDILKIIFIPAIIFFIISSIASPWRVLRYFVSVCGLIFVALIYFLYRQLQIACGEKICNIIMTILFCMIIISPCILHLEPELLYSDRGDIVEELSSELNLPTLYLYNSQSGGYLNDILLFSMIDESYIAKDMKCTEENIQKIFENKDISKGIILFINEGQDNEALVNTVESSLKLKNSNHLKKLTTCDVYYIY